LIKERIFCVGLCHELTYFKTTPERCLIRTNLHVRRSHSTYKDEHKHDISSLPSSLPSSLTSLASSSTKLSNKEWSSALSHAERLVGYPTSFLSLKFLLKDEISNLAIHLRRLFETKHPLIETAKYLKYIAFSLTN
jgi:hypothetical protein